MATLVLNSVTYSGLPNGSGNQNAWQPTKYQPKQRKIGITKEAADGTQNRVERAVVKRTWDLGWSGCNNATRLTLQTLAALNTSFTFSDLDGNSWTVFIEDPLEPEWAFNSPGGSPFWNCGITLKQV